MYLIPVKLCFVPFSDYVKNIHQENHFVILFHCVEYRQLTIMRKYKTVLTSTEPGGIMHL